MKENQYAEDELVIVGTRENNLKNISLAIPQHQLIVVTGLSGSGKSSLAFDTIYAEGQRRYMETFSAYARQFLGNLQYPDVDKISGLNPVVSIEQKTVNKNPRSTVGTVTEVYDFLRLLYARAAEAYSYTSGEKMVRYTEKELIDLLLKVYNEKNITLLAPMVKRRKGHYKELFENIRKQGFSKVRVDGEIRNLTVNMHVDRYKIHDIETVIDTLIVCDNAKQRLVNSLKSALKYGKGIIMVLNNETAEVSNYSKFLMCPTSGISYPEPESNTFSFNSPYGACEKCNGLGYVTEMDIKKIIPEDDKSIKEGAIAPIGPYKSTSIFKQLEALGERFNFTLNDPIKSLPDNVINIILYGLDEPIFIKHEVSGLAPMRTNFDGVVNFMREFDYDSAPASIKKWITQFIDEVECPECHGARLKKESLYFKIGGKSIADLAKMDISELLEWIEGCPQYMSERNRIISREILREISSRLQFLNDVGIQYLSLNRPSRSLSGGEAQRIRLATQISSRLVNVLYILDEPSIGLHQRDNEKLIQSLIELKKQGNSVIVVEHDQDMMESADFIVDLGPAAGEHGGEITAIGTYDDILRSHSLTADYLTGRRKIKLPEMRRKGTGEWLSLIGATGNNLKNVTAEFPLGTLICVTGVSGSGKSTLINETLYPILNHHFFRAEKKPLPYKMVAGLEHIDKVIEINQQPIGRTPRSNPATYVGVFDEIRQLFAELPEARIRGYKPGRFSFNVTGGRCETCKGGGVRNIEMNFLPDVYVQCETCNGKRYNDETLEIRYKGKSINDVLEMDITTALEFFENIPSIVQKLQMMHDVGLGYIRLGQPSTTLSGGEAQRVKLSTELSKRNTGNTFYILDEPTTGLHFQDIDILMQVLNKLVDMGNTVLIIEHNMDVIKMADWIIDLGPDGGKGGGNILAIGTPEEVVAKEIGYTAHYLKEWI
ncbi:MAG: excinuclease ABC subunit UvrA [Bacteroidales bacterium]|jgi:excinuclease ABC subunit A|nr:excinuclease ABC subunit UvrA [Bacteroidales bacterium]